MLSSTFVFFTVFAAAAQAGKAGLCWPWYNGPLNPGVFNTPGSQVSAIYDWETYQPPSTNGNGGLEFIGMQRCMECGSSPIAELHARWEDQKWTTVFTLNEPDLNGTIPGEAASWYIKNINPMPIQRALPAVSSSTAPGQGLNWISEMLTACAGNCQYELINLHWYGASFEQFQSYIESAHAKFPNNKIVVTEYALQNLNGAQADQVAFFRQAIPFLDNASYVELHFPFVATSPALYGSGDTSSCLFNDNGTPSPVGELLL